jgi:branched-chain amino acid transport system permease protein
VLSSLLARRSTVAPPRYKHAQYRSIALFVVVIALIGSHENNSSLHTELIVIWLAYSISVIGFYWIFGVAGRFAFCQTLMMALGAYLSAYLGRNGYPFWLCLLGAMVGVAIVAAFFGYLLRRTRAFYFAIGTLALTEIGIVVFTQWSGFTGPSGTVVGIPPITLFGKSVTSNQGTVWFFLGALAIVLLLNAWIERSPLWREAVGARELETVARSAGVRVTSVQVAMFAVGSAAGGLAGALLAHWNGFVGTDSYGIDLSIGIFLMLILGGSGSVWGPIIGAAIYVWLPYELSASEQYQTIIYGVILLIAIILMPEGITSFISKVVGWIPRPRRAKAAPPVESRDPALPQLPMGLEPDSLGVSSNGQTAAPDRTAVADRERVILEAIDVSVHFSGVRAVDGVSMQLHQGEVLGIMGPNGSGKTTLLNALTGIVPAAGQLLVEGAAVPLERPRASRAAGMARTYQSPQMIHPLTALDNVMLGSDDHVGRGIGGSWFLRPRMWRHERKRWQAGADVLSRVGLSNALRADGGALTYGDQRLVEIGRAMTARPKVMMLDEPSAGLNDVETIELVALLRTFQDAGIALIVIDHKLGLMEDICDRVLVLQLGRVIAEGTPEAVWRDPVVADAYLGSASDA